MFFRYNNEDISLVSIYNKNKKRRGKSKYLLSVMVEVVKNEEIIPAKVVYVRNRNKKKEYLCLISTNTSLSEEEIIRIYGKRWDTEVFFKVCKSYLNLSKECNVSGSTSKITYKTICVRDQAMSNEAEGKKNRKYWREDSEPKESYECIILKLMDEYKGDKLTYHKLKELKLTEVDINFQGAYKEENYPELFKYIRDVFNNRDDVQNFDDDRITKLAQIHSSYFIREKSIEVNRRYRDSIIAEYAKRKAKGKYLLCNNEAPFKDKNNRPYLEAHHIDWLANGGKDTIYNVVALCPNCHKKMHILR